MQRASIMENYVEFDWICSQPHGFRCFIIVEWEKCISTPAELVHKQWKRLQAAHIETYWHEL